MTKREKIKELRVKNNKKSKEIAELLNIDVTTYSKKEAGERKISLKEAKVLADYYNTSIEDLFFK